MARKPTGRTTTEADLLRTAAFILFDAAVFHEVLAGGANSKLTQLRNASTPLQDFFDSQWQQILADDYEPIFGLARDVLLSFTSSPLTEDVLGRIKDAATEAISSGVLLRHDFIGQAYHRLLQRTTAKFYATYFTKIPAAWLLANLALKTPHPAWNLGSNDDIASFRVLDPACGSGTLLSAAYMGIRDLYIIGGSEVLDLDKLHRTLVEEVLHAWDVLDYAAHLTLTTLALHYGRAKVEQTNVYTLPAGADADGVYLGSIDLLAPGRPFIGRGFTGAHRQQSMDGQRETEIVPPRCDLVIMNPPFSRSAKPNRKFGYSNKEVRERMSTKLRELTKQIRATGVGRGGLAPYFMLLALQVSKEDGRVAVVLPRSSLSGVSWKRIREQFAQQCEIEYVVSNHDPGRPEDGIEGWCWSENTDLGEVLLVARRTDAPQETRFTHFASVWRSPANEVEALLISHQIRRARQSIQGDLTTGEWVPLRIQDRTVGSVYRVPQCRIERNWLTPCVFAQPELNALLLDCLELKCCVPLSKVAPDQGIDIRQVKAHFAQSTAPTTTPILWGHQGAMNTIALGRSTLGWGQAKAGKGARASEMHSKHASTMLIAERPHLSTEALLAMSAPKAVLTTAFWELRLEQPNCWPCLVMWLNSTYGFLQYLGCATSSMGDIFKMKKGQLVDLPVADPTQVSAARCRALLRSIRHEVFLPFGREFAAAAQGRGARHTLDQFWSQELGIPPIDAEAYRLLSNDPIITKARL